MKIKWLATWQIVVLIILAHTLIYADSEFKYLWQPSGTPTKHWTKMTEKEKAFVLESYREQIQYAVKNIGKSFDEIDLKRLGYPHGYQYRTKMVTAGLIAHKYEEYKDLDKAAEYYREDLLAYQKAREEIFKTGSSSWRAGPGEYGPLRYLIRALEKAGRYDEAVKYYPLIFEDKLKLYGGKTDEERALNLIKDYKARTYSPENNSGFLAASWETALKKAKEGKIKPQQLEPIVGMHRQYHDGDLTKILQALDYYYEHRIRFMLKKASRHRDRKVKRKARELLKQLNKGSE